MIKRYRNEMTIVHPMMMEKQRFEEVFEGNVDTIKRRQGLRNQQLLDFLYFYSNIERMTLAGMVNDVALADVLGFASENISYVDFPEKSRATDDETAMSRWFKMSLERLYKYLKMSEEEWAAHKEKKDKQFEELYSPYDMLNLLSGSAQDLLDYRGQSFGTNFIDEKIIQFAKDVGTPVKMDNVKMTLWMACSYFYKFDTLYDHVEGFALFASRYFPDLEVQLTYWDMDDEDWENNKHMVRCLNGEFIEKRNSQFEPNEPEEFILRLIDQLR